MKIVIKGNPEMTEEKKLLTTKEAVDLIPTNRSTFLRAVDKLNIPNIKIPNDRKRYYRLEDVTRLRQEIYKDKIVIELNPPA